MAWNRRQTKECAPSRHNILFCFPLQPYLWWLPPYLGCSRHILCSFPPFRFQHAASIELAGTVLFVEAHLDVFIRVWIVCQLHIITSISECNIVMCETNKLLSQFIVYSQKIPMHSNIQQLQYMTLLSLTVVTMR